MRIRRKTNNCLNCGTALDGTYNYCPNCGQENNDNNVSFGTLLHDFFSNYFAFDSRFSKSIVPFLFKPGFLTNRYMEGKRMSYAHPLRLYLIISLFFFFIFSMIVKNMLRETDQQLANIENQAEPLDFLGQSDRDSLMQNISAETMTEVIREIEQSDDSDYASLTQALRNNTTEEERQWLTGFISTHQADSLGQYLQDTSNIKRITIGPDDAPINTSFSYDTTSNLLLFDKFDEIRKLSENDLLTIDQIIDSVSNRDVKGFDRHLAQQGIRIMRAEKEQVGSYIVKNLPIMMLILIPIFALVLKLLYIRRPFLYIQHVIHGFHLHSFAYLIYGLALIFTYFVIDDDGLSSTINFLIFILVTTYAYFSFMRVYKQGWFKTLIKFNMVGLVYLILIITFFVLEMFASFLSY